MKALRIVLLVLLNIYMINIFSSCIIIDTKEMKCYNTANSFLNALINEDYDKAKEYLSYSVVNSKEKDNKSVQELLDYIKGKITEVDIQERNSSESTGEKKRFYKSFFYSFYVEEKKYQGYIETCLYDTENPDNMGIYYFEIYPEDYYKWYRDNSTSFDRPFFPGIYIYDEMSHPFPPAGINSNNSRKIIEGFFKSIETKDTDKAMSYLSASAVNSDEKHGKTINDLFDYIYGKITNYSYYIIDSHIETTHNSWKYSDTYHYLIDTEKQKYEGYLDVCAYDTNNPENVGIPYIELAFREYYNRNGINEEKYHHSDCFGIFIYE